MSSRSREVPNPPSPEAERRQLTVMFCDLVGSTALSEQLDPEELREVVGAYQETGAAVITRFEGYIAQYLGDGILVYFGYPTAHEDDPQRAVRAGLAMVAAIEQLNMSLMRDRGISLAVRIGIHTGLVVVGEVGGGNKHEQLALGEAPNIAARLEGLAAPNTAVLSGATHRLVRGFFDCQSLGRHVLKGISEPMAVYRVLQETGSRNRLEAAASSLTPYVGREQELEQMLSAWKQVKEGAGQVILLTGEAGLGKSRLVQVFKERIAAESYARRELYCSPYYQNSPFYPLIEILRERRLQLTREDSPQQKLDKLERILAEYDFALAEVVPLFASLLSIPLDGRYAPLQLSSQAQKQKTLEVIQAIVLTLARQQPFLMVVEDLHWVDPSTLELLGLLIDQAPQSRLLLLCTARPAFKSPWSDRKHLSQIPLTPLPKSQTETLVKRVTGGKALPAQVLELVVDKSDRIPLFVEEMTKMVLESGWLREKEDAYALTGLLPSLAIPTTLQDLLMARLDRLEGAKEVAQLGATIGREFSYELLQAVSLMYEATLSRGLERLVEAKLLFQNGELPKAKYIFKHALIEDAAYQSLLRSIRQRYHQRIAQVLEEQFRETVETKPELLAHHYTKAGLKEQGIPYWHLAGQKAVKSSANVEAIAHLNKGLELLKSLPETPERNRLELDLQTALGPALIATKGYAAPEVELAYKRSEELCQALCRQEELYQQIGGKPQLFWVLRGLFAFYLVRAQHQKAFELAHQLMDMAQRYKDPALILEAHFTLWHILFFIEELAAAREHFEQGIALYNKEQHHSQAFLTGQDAGVTSQCFASWVLWLSGFAEQGLDHSHQALALAIELSHPFSLGCALGAIAMFHQYRRDVKAVREQAEAVIALSSEQGFAFWLASGTILRGWALAQQGQAEEGIPQMCQGLAAYRATGSELFVPYFLALLAEGYMKVGQTSEGLSILNEALAMVEKSGERFWEAEFYRLKGELLMKDENIHTSDSPSGIASSKALQTSVEDCFRQALDIARRQGAKSLELRAACSLARLWQQQGKKKEAHQLLAEIYGWFREGFDTVDLKEARALLGEIL